jgi:2-haloacid dehalogenase
MPRVIVCDVKETLVDLHALEPQFTDAFGDAHVLEEWWYSEVVTIAGPYVDFPSVGGATLDMMARGRGIILRPIRSRAFCKACFDCPPIPKSRELYRCFATPVYGW